MTEDWKRELRDFFNTIDLTKVVLERDDGKELQFGGVRQNKEFYKNLPENIIKYFSKPGDLGACLLFLKTHSVDDLLNILECPVCHKFNNSFRMNRSRGDKYFFCSKECRYSETAVALNMKEYKERTGYENPYANPEVQQKRRENFKKKYGVNTPMELKEFVEKNHESNRKNHGGVLAAQTEEIKAKIKETNLKNHDGVHNLQLDKTKERLKEVSREKFGTDYPLQNKEIREKQIEIYGGMGLASDILRKKAEETFGGALNASNPEIFKKIKDTVERKTNRNFSEVVYETMRKGYKEKYGDKEGFAEKNTSEKISKVVKEKYGVPFYCMTDECRELNKRTISKRNKEFASKVKLLGYNVGLDTIKLENYSYDVCLENEKILIEVDPTFTHNSTVNVYGKEPRDKFYHLNKTQVAIKNGYRCIHVWDWEDESKILSLIEKKESIYARRCEVKKITKEMCNDFLNKYHLQGGLRNQEVCYGLFLKEDLLEVMSFGKPRYNKSYQYELLRLCTLRGKRVIGGSNKLLKAFEKEYKPKSIISYCDYSKFTGDVYLKLGMSLVKRTDPSCHWCRKKEHYTDNLLRQQGADRLIGTNFGKGTNNKEIMISEGFVEVYDCGQLVFEKLFSNEVDSMSNKI